MIKKIVLNGTMYTLINQNEYLDNKSYYDGESNIAIESEDGMAYPLTHAMFNPGWSSIPKCPIVRFNVPENIEDYCMTDENTIDFTNVQDTASYYEKCVKYDEMEREIITTTTNQFKPKISEEDSPLLKLVKETVCDKNIDIDKYADRFQQFNNDKRLLSQSYKDITMKKSIEMLSNLDVDIYTITMNKNNDVPNPMGKPLIRKLTGDGEELEIDNFIDILKGEEE